MDENANGRSSSWYDAIIIGGGPRGPAGRALTLGRMHRRTLLLDSGDYRNGTVRHAHNLLTNDGRDPRRAPPPRPGGDRRLPRRRDPGCRRLGRRPRADAVTVTVGDEILRAHAVILATGVADRLPTSPASPRTGATASPTARSATVTSSPADRWRSSTAVPTRQPSDACSSPWHPRCTSSIPPTSSASPGRPTVSRSSAPTARCSRSPGRSSPRRGAHGPTSSKGSASSCRSRGPCAPIPSGARASRTSTRWATWRTPITCGPLFSLAAAIAGGQLAAVAIVQSLVMD